MLEVTLAGSGDAIASVSCQVVFLCGPLSHLLGRWELSHLEAGASGESRKRTNRRELPIVSNVSQCFCVASVFTLHSWLVAPSSGVGNSMLATKSQVDTCMNPSCYQLLLVVVSRFPSLPANRADHSPFLVAEARSNLRTGADLDGS